MRFHLARLTWFSRGVKLTCFNIAKGHRLALHVNSEEYRKRHPKRFLVLPGSTDYMLPAMIGRQHGCIGGPSVCQPSRSSADELQCQFISKDLREAIQHCTKSDAERRLRDVRLSAFHPAKLTSEQVARSPVASRHDHRGRLGHQPRCEYNIN
jgi:hypothetical protein